jgi:hypothetical protein
VISGTYIGLSGTLERKPSKEFRAVKKRNQKFTKSSRRPRIPSSAALCHGVSSRWVFMIMHSKSNPQFSNGPFEARMYLH